MSMGPSSDGIMGLTHSSSIGPTFLQFILKFFGSVSLYTAFESPRAVANFFSSDFFE